MKQIITRTRVIFLIGAFFLSVPDSLFAQNSSGVFRQLFPRNQIFEYEMLKAIGFKLDQGIVNVHLQGDIRHYGQLTSIQKAFGRLALTAAELLATRLDPKYTGPTLINDIQKIAEFKERLNGILAVLVISEVSKTTSDESVTALRYWAAAIFKSMKIRTAKSILNEFQKWENNPCNYRAQGYTPHINCATRIGDLFAPEKPKIEVFTKEGLRSMYGITANDVAHMVAVGLASATTLGATVGLIGAMSAEVGVGLSGGGLFAAFTGNVGTMAATGGGAAGIGTAGWAAVIAAPVAATILAAIVGITEGIAVVEATRVKPMLQTKLGAAISENVNIVNELADLQSKEMFFMAFMESAIKGYLVIPAKVEGEVRFYCQAGYVSKFKMTYTLNVDKTGIRPEFKKFEFTTRPLNLGSEESFTIPAEARDIRIEGFYQAGDYKSIFDTTFKEPTILNFTSFGTIFDAKVKFESPEVRSVIAKPNEFVITQGGGYVAWFTLTYYRGNQKYIEEDKGFTLGRRYAFKIPSDAKNIHLIIRSATGLVWEPWKQFFERTWPQQQNVCVKMYGTSLDPAWNNECSN